MSSSLADYRRAVEEFRFVQDETPLSSTAFMLSVVILFLATVFVGVESMKGRKPVRLTAFFFLHNVVLCLFSLVLCVSLGYAVLTLGSEHGLFWLLCSADTKRQGVLHFIYYVNYLGKLYELLDTHFLILKGRRPDFLQVYHHAATFFLTWVQLVHWSSVQWVPILANLFVHVVMYGYYALTTAGYRPAWKVWVTVIQIVQFVIDIGFIVYASYMHAVMDQCQGDMVAVWSGVFIISSYFLLFVELFYRLYIKKKNVLPAEVRHKLADAASPNKKRA